MATTQLSPIAIPGRRYSFAAKDEADVGSLLLRLMMEPDMAMQTIKKGSTDVSVRIRIVDSQDGTPETGVTSGTSGLSLFYQRSGEATSSITVSDLSALTDAHSDGGLLHIGNGYYRLDVPDAAFATGTDDVLVSGSATGMVVIAYEAMLVDYDPADSVRLGLTALPDAAADAAGGLPISDAGGLDMDAILADTNELQTDWADGGRLDLIIDAIQADTNELQGDWTDGGRLDLLIDEIQTDTNSLNDTKIPQTLNLTVSGNIGIDWANVENPGSTVDLAATDINLVDTTTTNTDMRGTDNALLASSAPTNWSDLSITATTGRVDIASIEGSDATDQIRDAVVDDTTRIDASALNTLSGHDPGSTIAAQSDVTGLNDLSAAEVNTQVDTALSDIGLDHLLSASVTGTDIADNSIIAQLVSSAATADWDGFDNTTDSLQAIRDRGDSAWTTATSVTVSDKTGFKLASDGMDSVTLPSGIITATSIAASALDGKGDWLLASSAPTNFSDLSITATTGQVDVASIEGSDATDQIRDAIVDDATRIDASLLNTLTGHDPGSTLAAQSDVTALNDPSAAAIADAVWDDTQADHTTAGTTGASLNNASSAPSSVTIADAVWDEARADHTDAGSFGEGVKAESLNTQAKADVNAEADTALTDYDPPTKAELDTAESNIRGADSDTLKTLSDQIDTLLTQIDSGDITTAGANKIADHVLRRAFATAAASSDGDAKSFRSLLGAVAKLVNKVTASGGTLTIYESDDVTSLGTQSLSTNANADPIVSADTT